MINKQRIAVVSALEAGSHMANAINTIKMAQGFAEAGLDVMIVCRSPASGGVDEQELARKYAISTQVKWHQVSSRFFGIRTNSDIYFLLQVARWLRQHKPELVFARNYLVPIFSALLGIATIAETHAHPSNSTWQFHLFIKGTLLKAFKRVITISPYLADHYTHRGMAREKLLVQPDAVDINMFRNHKKIFGENPYKESGIHIVYAGHLYDYKGIPTILECATLLPQYQFHLVGGFEQDVNRNKQILNSKKINNVTLHGLKQYCEVPKYITNASVLLLPPSLNHPSAKWTSPVKLAEYLASGKPVVASDIPALRNWLDENSCWFFKADDATDMKRAILQALDELPHSKNLNNAKKLAEEWTYKKRAENIISEIK